MSIRSSEFFQEGNLANVKFVALLKFLIWKTDSKNDKEMAERLGFSQSYFSELKREKKKPEPITVLAVHAMARLLADDASEVDRILNSSQQKSENSARSEPQPIPAPEPKPIRPVSDRNKTKESVSSDRLKNPTNENPLGHK